MSYLPVSPPPLKPETCSPVAYIASLGLILVKVSPSQRSVMFGRLLGEVRKAGIGSLFSLQHCV